MTKYNTIQKTLSNHNNYFSSVIIENPMNKILFDFREAKQNLCVIHLISNLYL